MADIHVVPIGDLIEHALSDDCVCVPNQKPVEANDGSIGWVAIHSSLDGRELNE